MLGVPQIVVIVSILSGIGNLLVGISVIYVEGVS